MNIQEFISKVFRHTLDSLPPSEYPEDLRKSLRHHERTPQFLINMVQQLQMVEGIKKKTIEHCIRDMTITFVRTAKRAKEIQMSSDMDRLMIKQKALETERLSLEADAFEQKGAEYVTSEKGLEEIHTSQRVTEEELR